MAYIKTIWKARKGSGLNRFRKIQETTSSVILNNEPNLIDEPGTPFSVKLMNNIEEGIEKAHFLIVEESVERKETDQSLQQAILNEVENRTIAVSEEARNRTAAIKEHDEKTTAHPDIRNILNRLTGLPEWDSDNHILTFTAEDGSTLEVDIPLENLIKEIDFDPATNEIILFKHDGTEIRINVGDLVDVYTGSIGTHIQIKIDDENEIQAILRAGSITRSELAAALLTELDDKANKNEVIPLNQKGAAGGVATLDNNGTIPANQLPEGGGLFTVARDETLRGDGTSGNPLGVNLPIGVTYRQGAGDYDPYEAGLPGEWALWNERVVTYEMIRESEWNALFSATPNYWTISESIPINQYRIWTPMGSTVSGTRRIIRANTAINSVAPKQINPIYWNDLPNIIYSFRRELHTRWDDDDFMIGGAVTYNGQQMRIVGILTPSGLFESFAGGNRPPFGEGVQIDRIRNIIGRFYTLGQTADNQGIVRTGYDGAFITTVLNNVVSGGVPINISAQVTLTEFNASRVIMTGAERTFNIFCVKRRISHIGTLSP